MKRILLINYILFTLLQGSQHQKGEIKAAVTLIQKHEGYSRFLYYDTDGYSIGYGTNLNNGISKDEAMLLLTYRVNKVRKALEKVAWYRKLSANRKAVILDMAYNLGLPRLFRFKDLIWCLKHNYYHGAANRMRNSLWYKQTKSRAKTLVYIMYNDKLPSVKD